MKTIKINIPTSFFLEVRTWWKERISKRYKHNRQILEELEDYICLLVRDDKYFMEISCFAKQELAEGPDCRIRRAFKEFVSKLKL